MLQIFLILFLIHEIYTSFIQLEIFEGDSNCSPTSFVYEGSFQTDKEMRRIFSNTTYSYHFQCDIEKGSFILFFCYSVYCDHIEYDPKYMHPSILGNLSDDSEKCFNVDGYFEIKVKNCTEEIPYSNRINNLTIGSKYKIIEFAYLLEDNPDTCSPDQEFFDFEYLKYFSSNLPEATNLGKYFSYYCDSEVLMYSVNDIWTDQTKEMVLVPWLDGTCIKNIGVSFLRTEVAGTGEGYKREEKYDLLSVRKFCRILSQNQNVSNFSNSTTILDYETFKEIDRFGINRLYSGESDPFLLNYVYWDSECSSYYTYAFYAFSGYCRKGVNLEVQMRTHIVDIAPSQMTYQRLFVNSTYNLYVTHQNDSNCENEISQISIKKLDSIINCYSFYMGGNVLYMKNTRGTYKDLQDHSENDLALFFKRPGISEIPDFQKYPPECTLFFVNNDFCMNKERQFIRNNCQSMKGHCTEGNPDMKYFYLTNTCENLYWYSPHVISTEVLDQGINVDFLCVNYTCSGISYLDKINVCSGHGECNGYDICNCTSDPIANRWYSGFDCKTEHVIVRHLDPLEDDQPVWWVWIPIGFVIVLILCCGVIIIYFVLFCVFCCCLVLVCFPLFCFGCICVLTQYRRIRRYKKLKDFDIYLNEQLLEKEHNIARFNINKKLFEIKYEDLKLLEIIGSGGSGSNVYKCGFKGSIVAFKRFRSKNVFNSEENFQEFEKELSIISSVSHRNILHFYGCCLTPPSIGIVMEYCPHGDIKDFLKKNENFNFKEKIRFFIEISCALDLLHSKSIIHRDLKCENVLLDDSLVCKVMDFGISKMVDLDSNDSITKGIGTCVYMSPEITRGSVYDLKVDVYSFGIMIWEICCQNFKPYGEKVVGIEYKVSNDPLFRPDLKKMEEKGVSMSLQKLAERCWDNDPSVRPSFEEIREFLEDDDDSTSKIPKKDENEEIILYIKKIEEDDDDSEDISISTPVTIEKLKEIAKQKWGDLFSDEISFFRLNSENRKYDKLISNDNDCENFLKKNDVVAVKFVL